MRKTALLLLAFIALPAGLWAAVQPVRIPCPDMNMAGGSRLPDPCPERDCCRMAPPDSLPAAQVAAPAEVKSVGFFIPPMLLQRLFAIASVRCVPAPVAAPIRLRDLSPPPLLIPLRV